MEQEHLHDPLRFQYASSTRTFSLRTKVIAIFMILIFISIPLYEVSPEAFKANYVYQSSPTYICALDYIETYPEMKIPTQYRQGNAKITKN